MHTEISFFYEILLNTIENLFAQVAAIIKYLRVVMDFHVHQQHQKQAHVELAIIQRNPPQQPILLLQNPGFPSFFVTIGHVKHEMFIPNPCYQPIPLIVIDGNEEMLRFEDQELMIFLYIGHSSEERQHWVDRFIKLLRSYLHLCDPYAIEFLGDTFVLAENHIRSDYVFGKKVTLCCVFLLLFEEVAVVGS